MSDSSAEASGSAYDPTVATDAPLPSVQAQRELYADEAEQAVETIKEKLAGMQESLKTAKAEAKRLRAEAREGAKDEGGE